MAKEGQFYRDRAKRLEKKEVARESARFAQQIRTVDTLVNALEDQLESQGLNKSELARLICVEPANIRRLFSNRGNPTVQTISDLAFELGLELRLVPIVNTKRRVSTPAPTAVKGLASRLQNNRRTPTRV
jgi:DNA-binding phage protein